MKQEIVDLILPGSLLYIYNDRGFTRYKGEGKVSEGKFLICTAEIDDNVDISCTIHCQGLLEVNNKCSNKPSDVYVSILSERITSKDLENKKQIYKLWLENNIRIYFYTGNLDLGIYDVVDIVIPK